MNLNDYNVNREVVRTISKDIDEACKQLYEDGFRKHLGASLIGDSCKRKLFYNFRWFKKADFAANVLRLFNRGHKEEARIVEWLEKMGCVVYTKDNEGNQFRFSDCDGHFGGSIDGVCILPEKYGISQPLLLEFKTSGDKPFAKLQQFGMKTEKPLHYSQVSIYGTKFNLTHCLYICVNKNDDFIHCEIVETNKNLAEKEIEKAKEVIFAKELPNRVSETRTSLKCKYCEYNKLCHDNEFSECNKNCRSCKHSTPIANASWGCNLTSQVLTEAEILKGCESHEFFGL